MFLGSLNAANAAAKRAKAPVFGRVAARKERRQSLAERAAVSLVQGRTVRAAKLSRA